jgi:hypothetical protein
MAKRQAVSSSSGGARVPNDLIAFNKEQTVVFDDFTVLIPSQTSPITLISDVQKIKLELPNIKSLRNSQIMLECTLLPGFTSTDGGDNYAAVLPRWVPLIASIINRLPFLLAVLPFAIATKLICFGIWSSG